MSRQPLAAHAVRMPDRDRAAVDIQPLIRNTEAVAAVEHLHGEGFVELPQIDVLDAQAGALEELRHGKHGTDSHLIGLATRNRETSEYSERLKAAFLGEPGAHDHTGAGAIRE